MFESKEFRFRTNVSVGTYESKAEAVACLSREGAKAIGKSKMAFKEALVTTDEFLQLATQGHAFCNLFQFDPQKEYWFEAKSGRRYKQRPLYSRGKNKGAMKLCFKNVFGMPVFTYARRERMKIAAKELRESDLGILEIAGLVGYNNGSKFAHAFQDVMGMTPKEYRKKYRMTNVA